MQSIHDLTLAGLREAVTGLGEPAFRAAQVFQWLWGRRARSFEEMSNVSKGLRGRLAESFSLVRPEPATVLTSKDGTVKFLLRLADGEHIETVLIPEKEHYTLCLSTQVGCAMACTFCSTGTMGFTRNLTHGEILGQILAAMEHIESAGLPMGLRNLVFMGMGEPTQNLDTLLAALGTMREEGGLAISPRRVTVSTVGLPHTLARFGASGAGLLAVSLHAPTQTLREKIMPRAAQAMPLDRLVAELRAYPLKPRERVTIEYILIGGINDSEAHARDLVRVLSTFKSKVNLIAYNPSKGSPYEAPALDSVLAFEALLRKKNVTTILRRSKGQDINAACGQLVTAHAMENPSA